MAAPTRLGRVLPAADAGGAVGAGTDPRSRPRDTTVPVRPLTFRELLDVPFALIQPDIGRLAGFAGILLLVGELAVVGATGGISHLTDGSDGGTTLAAILATMCCAWLLRFVLRGVSTAVGLARVFAEPIGWRTALSRFGTRWRPLLLFQALFTLVGVGVLLISTPLSFIGPIGLVWLGRLRAKRFVAVPIIMAEGLPARAAMDRAHMLARSVLWPRAGLWICQRLLFGLLAIPLLAIPLFISDISGTHRWAFIVLLSSAALLLVAFGEIVEASSRVVCYVDLRCRREGLDIPVPGSPSGTRPVAVGAPMPAGYPGTEPFGGRR
ncbi:hypothetical protein [Nocardia brevicatena]|uniref:hypothetical protein n=1 Tax=Nocardia brevicatena TaxID=37327 RepID=UPI0015764EA9|nr:hypothetical protein [Nocardia brevicatena]